ncbi:MAG: hypothetical protein Q8862_13445, partial [Bacteroidota bacterium]|nr:hypothetical protein [Bacteroidota bacterium]
MKKITVLMLFSFAFFVLNIYCNASSNNFLQKSVSNSQKNGAKKSQTKGNAKIKIPSMKIYKGTVADSLGGAPIPPEIENPECLGI